MKEDELSLSLTGSNDWFRALFEQSPMGVFVFDTRLRLTTCNAQSDESPRSGRHAEHEGRARRDRE